MLHQKTPDLLNDKQYDFISNEDLFCQPPDIKANCSFSDYLEPNEGTPINVIPHLAKMEKGWIVSTGTERSFFDLLLSPEEKCDGLIIRDINPEVKSYCDFLVLLLRVSESRDEFCTLSKMKKDNLAPIIKSRINQSDMSSKLKSYFSENFNNLASCYLSCNHLQPARGSNEGIEYRNNDQLFSKLQIYAKAGKIIPNI